MGLGRCGDCRSGKNNRRRGDSENGKLPHENILRFVAIQRLQNLSSDAERQIAARGFDFDHSLFGERSIARLDPQPAITSQALSSRNHPS
jgi:hypothetical protein